MAPGLVDNGMQPQPRCRSRPAEQDRRRHLTCCRGGRRWWRASVCRVETQATKQRRPLSEALDQRQLRTQTLQISMAAATSTTSGEQTVAASSEQPARPSVHKRVRRTLSSESPSHAQVIAGIRRRMGGSPKPESEHKVRCAIATRADARVQTHHHNHTKTVTIDEATGHPKLADRVRRLRLMSRLRHAGRSRDQRGVCRRGTQQRRLDRRRAQACGGACRSDGARAFRSSRDGRAGAPSADSHH